MAASALFTSAVSGELGPIVSEGAAQVLPWLPLGAGPVLLWGLFLFGTLAPDLDNSSSLLRTRVVSPVLRLVCRPRRPRKVAYGPNDIRGHRTWTHTFWMVAALVLAGWFFWRPLWALAAGYLIHLVLDSMSVAGIAWLWPLSIYDGESDVRKWVSGRRGGVYRVGGPSEYALVIVIVAISAGVICALACLGGARGADVVGEALRRVVASISGVGPA